jgi:hypothetical protein
VIELSVSRFFAIKTIEFTRQKNRIMGRVIQ